MATHKPLTAAEKARATRAANKAREIEQNVAFQNESRANGGRAAKKIAVENAIWNIDQPAGWVPEDSQVRKRTSSTAEETDVPAKKAREMKNSGGAGNVDDGEDDNGPVAAKKGKAKSKASVGKALPPAAASNDHEHVSGVSNKQGRRIDFTMFSDKATTRGKASNAEVPSKTAVASVKARTKIVADSASENDSEDSDDESDSGDAASDDNEFSDVKDFMAEVPKVIASRFKAANSDAPGSNNPNHLFDSDEEEFEVVRTKAQTKPTKTLVVDSDDSMSDAPPRLHPIDDTLDSDNDMLIHHQHTTMQQRSRKSSASSAMSAASALGRIHVNSDTDARDRRSSMGSSHSSGRHISVPGSELDSDEVSEVDAVPKKKKKKTKKVSAARQKQADAEKPEVKPEVLDNVVGDDDTAVAAVDLPEDSYHSSARLVYPAPGHDISLNAQPTESQGMLRDAITLMKDDVLYVDAYPRMVTRAGFARPYLQKAAAKRGAAAVHILDRLDTDPKYAALLAPIPIDRINIQRGNLKRGAVYAVQGFYGFAGMKPDQVMACVDGLLQDHRYIFPVTNGRLALDQPFGHGCISHIIKEEVFTTAAYVDEHLSLFRTGTKKRAGERELPDSMVALAATAVYAALIEFKATGRRQAIAFKEDTYESTYRNHMKTLAEKRKDYPNTMHVILHQLFNDVTDLDQIVHTTNGSSATLIQLIEIPDSD
ncbi:hypothetical protein R3P38DRAFT_3360084 [Favolaschia claudopus]|uniref:DUF6532 domain-containing protein n=1 Tax=Favolaschia claudopus TaxID=2862362 RepID=A0AAW0AXG9_9AGAR